MSLCYNLNSNQIVNPINTQHFGGNEIYSTNIVHAFSKQGRFGWRHENVFHQLLRVWEQIASSCCDNLEQFVVDIGPVKASLNITQF